MGFGGGAVWVGPVALLVGGGAFITAGALAFHPDTVLNSGGLLPFWLALACLAPPLVWVARKLRKDPAEREADGDQFRSDLLQREVQRLQSRLSELAVAHEEVIGAAGARSEFLANMSHELRTPLNGILGFVELLGMTELADDQREYIGQIQESGRSLLALIEDILELASMERHGVDLEPQRVALAEVVRSSVEVFEGHARDKGVALDHQLASECPPFIRADPRRLHQILTSLLANAVKFTDVGSVRLCAQTVRDPVAGRALALEVIDTGVGIQPSDQERVFQPFVQADGSNKRKHGGTGLGLAIASRLASMMGGRIDLWSSPGEGSTFRVLLPMSRIEASLDDVSLEGRTVIVAVQRESVRTELREILTRWGGRVLDVPSLEGIVDALGETVDAREILAVFIDHGLVLENFSETVSSLREFPQIGEAPLVLLSRLAGGGPATPRSFGRVHTIGVPLDRPEISSCVQKLTDEALRGTGASDTHRRDPRTVRRAMTRCRPLDILLVEDNPVNQRLHRLLLEKGGHRITIAENGLEAVRVVTESRFDLALMDVQMPMMDGLQATIRIRAMERDDASRSRLPILAVTARALDGDRELCLEAGMDAYIAKPIEITELYEALANIVPGAIERAA